MEGEGWAQILSKMVGLKIAMRTEPQSSMAHGVLIYFIHLFYINLPPYITKVG